MILRAVALFLASVLILAAQSKPGPVLPPRFPLPASEPSIRENAQPHRFAEAVGRRAALLGREDGTFEAWINPVKVLRDFRLSVYFDGALEPAPLGDLAEQVIAGAGRTTIVHSHAAFTIRQTWFAPLDRPALVVLLDIDTTRPLRLRASFVPEMQPMWPASFGGQTSSWSGADGLLVLSEGLRRHAAVIGSPLFSRSSEEVGHQLPGRTMLLEMDVSPEICREHLIPIVIAGSAAGVEGARKIYRETLASLQDLVSESDNYYRDFQAKTLRVHTPEPRLDQAFDWAKLALEKGWACNEGVGCGLVAGYGPSGTSARPGFGWYFGGDALINTWSIVDYGDLDRARAVLEFLRDHQREDGKILHELTQSAALVDWSAYPYGYYHGETTPLYLFSAARYVVRSADQDFLRASWPSLDKAYRFCLSTLDADGLMSNRKAGMAATETGALSGRVDEDIYLQGAWLAGLEGYGILAGIGGHKEEAEQARKQLEAARKSLDKWFRDDKGYYAFGKLADGNLYDAQSAWQALALAYGGLDAHHSERAADSLRRPQLSAPWGTRLFATDSPAYDPLSYNDGSVWPFVTGFAALAEFRNHRARAGLQHLWSAAALTGFAAAGFVPEYLSGDRAQVLPRAVPHQLFSSAAVIHPLVRGLLGLGGDALEGAFSFVPHLPARWESVRFDLYRIGQSWVSGELARQAGGLRVRVTVIGKPLKMYLAPALPPGSTVRNVRINNKRASAKLETSDTDVHAVVETNPAMGVEVVYQLREGLEAAPELPSFQVGDAAPATAPRVPN